MRIEIKRPNKFDGLELNRFPLLVVEWCMDSVSTVRVHGRAIGVERGREGDKSRERAIAAHEMKCPWRLNEINRLDGKSNAIIRMLLLPPSFVATENVSFVLVCAANA